MGVSYYGCNCCGDAFSEYEEEYETCNCGNRFCSKSCASDMGYEFDTEKDKGTCSYCTGENFEDDQVLRYALKLLNKTREDLVKEMIINK